MMNLRTIKMLSIVGLIIALAIIASILPLQSQSQAMLAEVEEQSQVVKQQTSPQGNATATITITWTTVSNHNEVCEETR